MNLIKKNIILVIVLSITLILAGVMIFFVIQATGKMKESAAAVADLRKKINELNEKSPAPLKENLERINNDYKMIVEKVKEIQPVFGTPYKKPLELFAKELEISVPNLKSSWRKTYREEIKKGSNRTLIFVKFLSKLDSTKLAKATEAFTNAVNKNSLEKIDETNINGSIMEAMDLPRKMDEISCKTYIRNMQINVVKYMKETEKGDTPFTFKDEKVAEKLSFEKYEDAMPRPDEVQFIFKHWRMIEDLCRRLKASKVNYLESISRNNLLKGDTVAKKYLIFSYTIKVKGPLNSIRALLNTMMDAYKDDKIYIIKSLTLETNDEAATILGTATKTGTTAVAAPKRRVVAGRPNDQEPEEEKKAVNVQILGVSNTVSAEIKFEYVLFIGNEIQG